MQLLKFAVVAVLLLTLQLRLDASQIPGQITGLVPADVVFSSGDYPDTRP